MRRIFLLIEPKPKPRGSLGRHGNMTHSSGDYREWQVRFRSLLYVQIKPEQFPSDFYCLNLLLTVTKKFRGRDADRDNLIGSVFDAMQGWKDSKGNVYPGWINNDNWRTIPRGYEEVREGLQPSIEISVCSTMDEALANIEGIMRCSVKTK